ncbi:MAG: hypothetical protein HRU19_29535 [Pseudobacteriovorax sp.]|nr:hypothetical protein [Pseudobacteriovorax sp.]
MLTSGELLWILLFLPSIGPTGIPFHSPKKESYRYPQWPATVDQGGTDLELSEGVFTGKVKMRQGFSEYKLVVDGSRWLKDPTNPNSVGAPPFDNSTHFLCSGTSRIYSFVRRTDQQTILVVINLGNRPVKDYELYIDLPNLPQNPQVKELVHGWPVAMPATDRSGIKGYRPLELLPRRSVIAISLEEQGKQ